MELNEFLYERYIKDFKCKYYITKNTKKYIDERDTVNFYGVKIDKIDNDGSVISSASVKNVGINENDVKNFIKILEEGKVTPITLEDIVKDYEC